MKRTVLRGTNTGHHSHGQGLVEFSLVVTLLMLVAFGIVETSRLVTTYLGVHSASREAARYGASAGLLGFEDTTSSYKDCDGIRAAAKRVGLLAPIADDGIVIQFDSGPGTSPTTECPPTFDISAENRIIVTVTSPYTPIVPLVNMPAFKIQAVSRRTILKGIEVEE